MCASVSVVFITVYLFVDTFQQESKAMLLFSDSPFELKSGGFDKEGR